MDIKIIASGSTGNSYLVSDGKSRLLIEAGVPLATMQRGCGYTLTTCAGCLISHNHGDHAGHAKAVLNKGVDIFTSAGTIAAVGLSGHRVHAVTSREPFIVGTFECMSFDVEHDAPEPFGFLLRSTVTREKLLYFTDTPMLRYQFRGVTIMMAECNYDRDTLMNAVECGSTPVESVHRLCDSHMGLDALLEILSANDISDLRKIYLIHLSNRHANEKRIKKAVQAATGVEVIVC